MSANNMMTPEEYVEAGGLQCPYCRSDDIEGQRFDGEGRSAWSEIQCRTCGERWLDIYTLTHFEKLEDLQEA